MIDKKPFKTNAIATGSALLKAYNRAAKRVQDEPQLLATSISAGFIIPNGQKRGKRKGWQVFVRLVQYSDEKLQREPNSGGLATSI